MTVTNNIYQKHKISRIQCGYKFRIDRTCSSICNTTCVSDFHLKSKHIIQKCLADMGTGITDNIGGPHDFLSLRSDTVHSRAYCDRCPTSDMSDLTCQTTGRMETGAIKRVIKLES